MSDKSTILDRLKVLPQYLLPQHFLTSLVFRATRWQWSAWKNFLIKTIIDIYKVDMSLAKDPDYTNYPSFNAFFTRELLESARPLADSADAIACPVDGQISQIGLIEDGKIIQAKGHNYTVENLLAGDVTLAENFQQGQFSTLYLAPRDYHRIHIPVDGELESMTYVPGKLFAVNDLAARNINQLFARNERVVTVFSTELGKVAVILVGALFVGSMETVWAGQITPTNNRCLRRQAYEPGQVTLKKGEELGRFNMGSTVILLFEEGKMRWNKELTTGKPIIMGQEMGKIIS